MAAAQGLLAERGLAGLTMDAVAERAGVGKATVYKWWSSKGVLALDALLRQVDDDVRVPDTGDLAADLTEHIQRLVVFLRDTVGGRTVTELIGQGQQDPATAAAVRDAWIAPRRRGASQRIDTALARGELRPGLDGDLVLDLLYGPVYYRLLIGHGELSDDLPAALVDAALRGVAPRGVVGG